MASPQKKGNAWYCQFYWADRRLTFSLGRVTPAQAEARATRAGEIIDLLSRGVLQLPDGVGVVDYVRFDGRPPARESVPKPVTKRLTLGDLRDQFLAAREAGREASTQATKTIHFRHLVRAFGESFALPALAQADLQRYIRDRPVSAITSRKEVTTLRTAWNWAVDSGLLAGAFSNKGLIYPKEAELPLTGRWRRSPGSLGVSLRLRQNRFGNPSTSAPPRWPTCWGTSGSTPATRGSIRSSAWRRTRGPDGANRSGRRWPTSISRAASSPSAKRSG